MGKMVQRGYVPSDKREFSEDGMEKLLAAGSNLYYLLNRGYPIKSASVFVGNHYLLSGKAAAGPGKGHLTKRKNPVKDG